MAKTSNKQDLGFQIKGIEIIDFSLIVPDKKITEFKLFHYNIQIEHRMIFEKKLIYVICSVEIFHEDNQTILGKIKTSNIFEINDFNKFIDKTKPQNYLPDELILNLNSISISTTRGVMFSQFKGTFLHNAFLPVVDPTQLLMSKVINK